MKKSATNKDHFQKIQKIINGETDIDIDDSAPMVGIVLTRHELNKTRQSMIDVINNSFDRIIAGLDSNNPNNTDGENLMPELSTEWKMPITTNPVLFRKQKTLAVIFGKKRVHVKTWAGVVVAVLTHCIQDPVYHDKLMELRGRIAGKERFFIAKTPDSMKRPKKICEGLYVEVTYGSETLMHILVNRILWAIHYDCSDIYVVLKQGGVTNG